MKSGPHEPPDTYGPAVSILIASVSRSSPIVVALTSVHSGEGVTHTIGELVHALKSTTVRSVGTLELNSSLQLASAGADGIRKDFDGLSTMQSPPPEPRLRAEWLQQEIEHRAKQVDILLIDCPALRRSSDALMISPMVSGILVVVEADRTTRQEIASTEAQIALSGGHLVGFILNRSN